MISFHQLDRFLVTESRKNGLVVDPATSRSAQTDQQARRDTYDSERTRHQCLANRISRASPGGPLCPSKGAHCHLMSCLGVSKR